MKTRILIPLVALGILVLGVGFFVGDFSVKLQPALQNPPLTPAQYAQVLVDINAFHTHSFYGWDNGEDVYDEFEPDEMPENVRDHFMKRLKNFGDLVSGCWALPNTNRPIDTDNHLRKWGPRLEAAADRDDDADRTSSNPADWDLEKELDAIEKTAKSLIVAWCNQGQPANAREFCPCNFNCAGGDNVGKTWNVNNYVCQDNCKKPQEVCSATECTCGSAPSPLPVVPVIGSQAGKNN